MRSLRTASMSAFVCLFAAGSAAIAPLFAQVPSSAKSDETAIKEVVRKYVEAREARDPKAIEPLLTADADQLVSDGTWRRGATSWSGACSNRRGRPAAGEISRSSRSGSSRATSRWPTAATPRRAWPAAAIARCGPRSS